MFLLPSRAAITLSSITPVHTPFVSSTVLSSPLFWFYSLISFHQCYLLGEYITVDILNIHLNIVT
jgi:hypothetical protein